MNRQRGNILKMTIDRRRRKCDEGCTGFVFFSNPAEAGFVISNRLTLVARLPPTFYIVPHAGWNYGIVTSFL